DCDEHADAPLRKHDSRRAANAGDEGTLRHELSDDARTSSAERRADADLMPARRRADEQQVDDVRTCDQQYKEHGATEDPECGLRARDEQIDHWTNVRDVRARLFVCR